MLLTSCKDNICRLWVETILPEDGLVDLQHLDPNALNNPMFHTHRHKNRFMQRLHHIRNVVNKRKSHLPGGLMQGIAPLPSTQSIHDFHKFGVHPNSVAPGFHFHLAASINPDTGKYIAPGILCYLSDSQNQLLNVKLEPQKCYRNVITCMTIPWFMYSHGKDVHECSRCIMNPQNIKDGLLSSSIMINCHRKSFT